MIDTHTHTFRSDGERSPEEMALAAIEHGLDKLIITDHYDIDAIIEGNHPAPDFAATAREIYSINEKLDGKIKVYLGIELGQGYLYPKESADILKKYDFSFVISSVHNLEGKPDFWCFDYRKWKYEDITAQYREYINDLIRAARVPGAHTLAHITYPARYIHNNGDVDLTFEQFYDDYSRLFRVMVEEDVALEINTSDCRRNYKISPEWDLLSLYFDCGGKKITVGTDAHRTSDVGVFSQDKVDGRIAALIDEVTAKDLSDVVLLR